MEPGLTLLASEFFGAVKNITALVPKFDERKKKAIEEETEKLAIIEKRFNDVAVEFRIGSRTDELMGLADLYKAQELKLKNLYIIYDKELRGANE